MRVPNNFRFFLIGLLTIGLIGALSAQLANFRPYSQEGVNVFETPKQNDAEFEKLTVRIGGNFTQQFQALDHSNTGVDLDGDGVFDNPLQGLAPGFNLATANLNLDVQLAEGIRLNLITYLSSRHHPESWVKGGYIQIDEAPFLNSSFVDGLMENVTLRLGHMEVNYGDAHFRRTDNGNALYNPFVGNYIMDAFNTEIGTEVYFQKDGFLAMLGITGGEIKGDVTEVTSTDIDDKAARSATIIGKLGYDKQLTEDLRLRITGSVYNTGSSARNFLYNGDRGGSRYYLVTEAPGASTSSNFTSGRYNPLFMDKVMAVMGNVFVKYNGLEFFGTYETTDGRMNFETDTRNATQLAGDLIYRIGAEENVYLGARYNTLTATEIGGSEITINRYQLGGGWFLTDNILLKAEYVNQDYVDFSDRVFSSGDFTANRFFEANFNGIMIEAVVGF